MASPSDRRRLLEELAEGVDPVPVEDLARLSVEAFQEQLHPGQRDASSGTLRLFGPGVAGNTVPISDVGVVLDTFQRLVAAVGAALRDHVSNRGAIPGYLLDLTRLRMTPETAAGSLVVTVRPEADPEEEMFPDGEVPLLGTQPPLVDDALERALGILSAPGQGRLDNDQLGADLTTLGHRTAAAARTLAARLDRAGVGLDVAWRVPGEATRRGTLTHEQARGLVDFVDSGDLAEEVVTVDGVVRTSSNLRGWGDLEAPDVGTVRVEVADIPEAVLDRLSPSTRVRVTLRIEETVLPGGREHTRFVALDMLPLDEVEHPPAPPE